MMPGRDCLLSSLAEEELLADPDYRKQLAAKIFQGIADLVPKEASGLPEELL